MSLAPSDALYRGSDVRELDRVVIEEHGIPGITLMERAGAAAFAALARRWPGARRIAVACGAGNNAGDGFVVARLAAAAGLEVRVATMVPPDRLAGDAAAAFRAMRDAGIAPVGVEALLEPVPDVVVDALLGTGLAREVAGAWAALIARIGACGVPALALDIPSGLDADTGRVHGSAVRAEATVTFIGLKRGLLTGRGPALAGEIELADLDVPEAVYEAVPAPCLRVCAATRVAMLAPRARDAHKGDHGHVLVVGGDLGYQGAARLAGEAAARAGAGLVSVATRAAHAALVSAARPELMARGVEDAVALAPLAERASVVAVGPGLGRGEWGRAMLDTAAAFDGPLVLDADGLNLLAEGVGGSRLSRRAAPTVLTPHPGEAGRLLGCAARDVEADRFAAARAIAEAHDAVVVLKGAGSLVAAPEGPIHVCVDGNPGMATGGTGDVLTGIVGALLAQGLDALDAALTATCVHGAAGDRAAARGGERGMLASDLLVEIRGVLAGCGTAA